MDGNVKVSFVLAYTTTKCARLCKSSIYWTNIWAATLKFSWSYLSTRCSVIIACNGKNSSAAYSFSLHALFYADTFKIIMAPCWREPDAHRLETRCPTVRTTLWTYRLVTAVHREAAPPSVHTDWLVILPCPQTVSSPGRGWLTAKLNWATAGRGKLPPGSIHGAVWECSARRCEAEKRTAASFGPHHPGLSPLLARSHLTRFKRFLFFFASAICGVWKRSAFIPAPLSGWCDKSDQSSAGPGKRSAKRDCSLLGIRLSCLF